MDMKPYTRHTMSKVLSTADLLLLMCIASMACPAFGNHDIFPLDVSRFEEKAVPLEVPVLLLSMCMFLKHFHGIAVGRAPRGTGPSNKDFVWPLGVMAMPCFGSSQVSNAWLSEAS